MPRLDLPAHVQQMALGYCLPACGQMALAQLGIAITQEQLARTLGTRVGVGTPFSRVERLSQWGVHVCLTHHASIDELRAALTTDTSVIVALATTPGLPGWGNIRTQHTVLVIDVGDPVSYHDPALAYGPVFTLRTEFLLAWSEMDERAAFLSRD